MSVARASGWAGVLLATVVAAEVRTDSLLERCPTLTRPALVRALRIELQNPARPSRAEAQSLFVGCRDGRVELRVDGEPAVTRELRLSGVEHADHARLVALAAAELLDEARYARPRAPARVETAPALEPAPSMRPPARPSPLELGLLGSARGGPSGWLWGGSGAARWARDGGPALLAELSVDNGASATALGRVDRWLLSGSAAVAWPLAFRRARVDVGGGLRAGWARLVGVPSGTQVGGAALEGMTFGPLAVVRASYPLGDWELLARVESGVSLRSVVGDVGAGGAVRVGGGWLSVGLGVGVRL